MYALRSIFSHCSRHFTSIDPPLQYFFSSSSSSSSSSAAAANGAVVQYLMDTFKLPIAKAQSIMSSRKGVESTEKPRSVYKYLSEIGFSDAHIQSTICTSPQIAFIDVEKTLKPKIEFFQSLGLVGSDLGKFISRRSLLLTASLKDRLRPNVEIIKNVLPKDEVGSILLLVMKRCTNGCLLRFRESRLLGNINYFRSCGIVDSQLSMLLKHRPALFALEVSRVRDLVSIAVEAGFSKNTKMFVHGLHSISSVSKETFKKKVELICSFGFTEKECLEMFTSTPLLIKTSISKLKTGLTFFINEAKVSTSTILGRPTCLMHSMEGRVLPRYRVLLVVKSKQLTNGNPDLVTALRIPDEDFFKKFVYRFPDDMEDLLMAYGGKCGDALQHKELAAQKRPESKLI